MSGLSAPKTLRRRGAPCRTRPGWMTRRHGCTRTNGGCRGAGQREGAALNKAGGRIAYRFHARDLHLVMGPAAPGTTVKFRVMIDGAPPGAAHGVYVDESGNGTVA